MNRQVVFFPFNSSWTGNDLLIAKPLDQSYVDLILQLLTYVTDSQKLLRDLLIVCQKLDYCQLPVVFFIKLRTGSFVLYNPFENPN